MGDPTEAVPETAPGSDDEVDPAALEAAAEHVAASERLLAFTGAGVSTESGIPDFRSPGGIWDRHDPRDFTIQAFRADPAGFWERRLALEREAGVDWAAVEPNDAHRALARLEAEGPLTAVVTQNVDGLHQAAGNDPDTVLELHGTRRAATCLGCDRRLDIAVLERKLAEDPLPPRCDDCGGLLKRATVAFGQQLPADVLRRARAVARDCDCCLVVGSSLEVEPAASIPRIAADHGAALIVVNLTPTPIDDRADAVLRGRAGTVLPMLVDRTG